MKNYKQLEMEKQHVEEVAPIIFGWGSCGTQVGKKAMEYINWYFLLASESDTVNNAAGMHILVL